MRAVTLAEMLARARPHATWRAPVDARLRWAAIASLPILVLGIVAGIRYLLVGYPALMRDASVESSLFFLRGSRIAVGVLAALDAMALLAYVPMMVLTRALKEASAEWQWVAFAEASLGVTHVFIAAVAVAVGMVVVVASIIVIIFSAVFAIASVLIFFGILAAAS